MVREKERVDMSFPSLSGDDRKVQEKLAKQFREDVDDFKEAYRALCVKWGGKDWDKSQFETLFRHINKEIISVWTSKEGGEHQKQFVKALCDGAANCLITGAPFKFYKRSPDKLARAAKMLSQEDKCHVDRWEQAFVKIAKEEHAKKETEKLAAGLSSGTNRSLQVLPLIEENEDRISYRMRVLYCLKSFLTAPVSAPDLSGDDHTAIAFESIKDIVLKAIDRQAR